MSYVVRKVQVRYRCDHKQVCQSSCFKEQRMILFYELHSSCPEVFCKKGVLRNFTKFIGKHLCQSLLFNKAAGLHLVFFIGI